MMFRRRAGPAPGRPAARSALPCRTELARVRTFCHERAEHSWRENEVIGTPGKRRGPHTVTEENAGAAPGQLRQLDLDLVVAGLDRGSDRRSRPGPYFRRPRRSRRSRPQKSESGPEDGTRPTRRSRTAPGGADARRSRGAGRSTSGSGEVAAPVVAGADELVTPGVFLTRPEASLVISMSTRT